MCYSAWNTQPQPHNGISSPSIILLLTPTSSEVTKTRLYSRKSVPTFFIHWYLSHTYTMQFRNVRVLADCSNLAGDLNRLSSRKIFTKLGRPIKSANRPKDRRREREREKRTKKGGWHTTRIAITHFPLTDHSMLPAVWNRMSNDLITRYALPTLPSLTFHRISANSLSVNKRR